MKIEYIPRAIAELFAEAYAGINKGFSAKQISEYFIRYSNLVKHLDFYGVNPTRHDLFIDSLYSLEPKQQYYSLNDLTIIEYESKYVYPDPTLRISLRNALHILGSPNPIGLLLSNIRETSYRTDWIESVLSISSNPPNAITAARTMLETALKSILSERSVSDTSGGDLIKLVRLAEDSLHFIRSAHPAEHQFFSGIASIINAISSISNIAGDRHGTIGGISIDDPSISELCVNTCGTMSLFFIELHLLTPISAPSSD